MASKAEQYGGKEFIRDVTIVGLAIGAIAVGAELLV